MCKIEPHIFFPPLLLIVALPIGIEYDYEHLIGDMIDCQVRRLVRRTICFETRTLTCLKSVGSHFERQLNLLMIIRGHHGFEREQVMTR